MEEQITFSEKRLQKFKLVLLQYLGPKLIDFGEPPELEFSTVADWMSDDIVLRIKQEVWGREVERQEHQWPADWWQAVKERWFPAWAKKRWPIKYRHVRILARELYPKMRFEPDAFARTIAVSKSEW